MPYSSISELPEQVDALPEHAKEIWMEAYNAADKDSSIDEPAAVAWSAIKQSYKKDEDGNWVAKSYVIKAEDDELQYTLGVVYPVNEVDLQDDWSDEQEVRKAAWDYLSNLQQSSISEVGKTLLKAIKRAYEDDVEIRIDVEKLLKIDINKNLGNMHREILDDGSEIVESYLAPVDFEIGGQFIKKGDWLLGCVWSDEMWNLIKNGERTGLSIGGMAERIEE